MACTTRIHSAAWIRIGGNVNRKRQVTHSQYNVPRRPLDVEVVTFAAWRFFLIGPQSGNGSIRGDTDILFSFCSCGSEHISITAAGAAIEEQGLAHINSAFPEATGLPQLHLFGLQACPVTAFESETAGKAVMHVPPLVL